MIKKHKGVDGYLPSNRVFTDEQAREVYRLKGKVSANEVAKRFGVCRPTITDVWSARTYFEATLELRQQEHWGGVQ